MSKDTRRFRRDIYNKNKQKFETLSFEQKIERLEESLESAKASTYEAINSHHRDFLTIRLYGQDPLDELTTLGEQCETTKRCPEASSSGDGISMENVRRLRMVESGLHAIVGLAKAHANLKDIDEQILHGEIAVAASTLVESQSLLQELQNEEDEEGAGSGGRQLGGIDADALGILQTQCLKKRSALKAELEYLVASMYEVSDMGSVRTFWVSFGVETAHDGQMYSAGPITPSDLLFALTNLGGQFAEEKLDSICNAFSDLFLIPLIGRSPDTDVPVVVSKTKATATIQIGSFAPPKKHQSQPDSDPSAGSQWAARLRDKWYVILDFICDCVFHDVNVTEDHFTLYRYFGERLWDRVCVALRPQVVEPVVSSCVADPELEGNRGALDVLLEIEEKWVELGLIGVSDMRVKEAARSELQIYVNRRRHDLLATIASVLTSDDTNTVAIGGNGPEADVLCELVGSGYSKNAKPGASGGKGKGGNQKGKALGLNGGSSSGDDYEDLALPRCSISVQAQTLVEFAHETIALSTAKGDNGSVGTQTAALSIFSIRDALNLYRSVIPTKWLGRRDAGLGEDTKRAFVVFNDCEFIAHHLTTLGFRQRTHWPKQIKLSTTFVDEIGHFRTLSKSVMHDILGRHRSEISSKLCKWRQENSLVEFAQQRQEGVEDSMLEEEIAASSGLLRHVAYTANAILARTMACRVIGILLDIVVAVVVERIDEFLRSRETLAHTGRSISRLVIPVSALDKALFTRTRKATTPELRIPAHKYCPRWEEFQERVSALNG